MVNILVHFPFYPGQPAYLEFLLVSSSASKANLFSLRDGALGLEGGSVARPQVGSRRSQKARRRSFPRPSPRPAALVGGFASAGPRT